jgi:hypothetical protein
MEIIADVFKKYCMKRLKLLEEVNFIFNSSETINQALGLIFMHSSLYPDSNDQIIAIQVEIHQLESCINATEVGYSFKIEVILMLTYPQTTQENMQHARKMCIVNFGHHPVDPYFTFYQEICYSYVCKMLHSYGPRRQHFSNTPTHDEIVEAELFLALNSPYSFAGEEDLLCYESME